MWECAARFKFAKGERVAEKRLYVGGSRRGTAEGPLERDWIESPLLISNTLTPPHPSTPSSFAELLLLALQVALLGTEHLVAAVASLVHHT